MEIRPLDPADDAQMKRFHEIMWRAEKEDGRDWNAMLTYDELASLFRRPTSDSRNLGVAAFEGDQMVGAGWVQFPLLDNLDSAWSFLAVEPELRGRGIGTAVLDGLVGLARADSRTQMMSNAAVPFEERESSPILAWAKSNGFAVANVEIQRDLPLPVDPSLLEALAAEAAERHDGYDIRSYVGGIPDELRQSLCDLSNQFVLEAPMGDVELEAEAMTPEVMREREEQSREAGRTVYTSLAVNDGRVVAHSNFAVSTDGAEAHQWGTLVHRDHRGHRLGLAVKVANLRALAARQPDVERVVTTNAETNPWMVAINDRLGFTPVAVVPMLKRTL